MSGITEKRLRAENERLKQLLREAADREEAFQTHIAGLHASRSDGKETAAMIKEVWIEMETSYTLRVHRAADVLPWHPFWARAILRGEA